MATAFEPWRTAAIKAWAELPICFNVATAFEPWRTRTSKGERQGEQSFNVATAVRPLASRALVLARVCGTRADPQDSARQEDVLRSAGVLVAPSNAGAARLAVRAVTEVK